MNRILQLGMTDNLGGIETFLINYYRNIDKESFQFDFVNIYPKDLCFQNEIEAMGGIVYKVSSYYKHPFKYIKEVKKIIESNQYDIVHCNMNSASMMFPLIAAKSAKAKIIISHAHNASSDKGLLKSIMHNINKKFIPKYANKFWACSDKAGKWFYSDKIREKSDYKIVNNAIDIEKFKYNEEIRKNIRIKLGIEEEALLIGHVGRFSKQKNHIFLVDIFKKIYDKNINSKLVLIGVGELQDEIKSKVKELALEDVVIFRGQVDNVNEYMQAFDIFLFPSLYEGLPFVGIEAQAAGLPCYFSNTITDELDLLETNKFIPLDIKPEIWSEMIQQTYKNVDRNDGYNEVTEKGYNIINEVKKMEELYKECVEKI